MVIFSDCCRVVVGLLHCQLAKPGGTLCTELLDITARLVVKKRFVERHAGERTYTVAISIWEDFVCLHVRWRPLYASISRRTYQQSQRTSTSSSLKRSDRSVAVLSDERKRRTLHNCRCDVADHQGHRIGQKGVSRATLGQQGRVPLRLCQLGPHQQTGRRTGGITGPSQAYLGLDRLPRRL